MDARRRRHREFDHRFHLVSFVQEARSKHFYRSINGAKSAGAEHMIP
jgi:hypothetical protein